MRIAPLLLALSAALLASCAGWHGSKHVHPQQLTVERAKPNTPKVEVINDAVIVVDQEPIYIPRNYIDKSITWEIVPSTSPYSIAAVSVDAEATTKRIALTNCRVLEGGKKARCENTVDEGKYKYTISVSGPARIDPLDPWIWNGR